VSRDQGQPTIVVISETETSQSDNLVKGTYFIICLTLKVLYDFGGTYSLCPFYLLNG